jgi:mRNA interferase MazF
MYTPERGDVAWLDFDPQAGKEQAKRRPALVLSPSSFNHLTGFALVCPITRTVRGYVFEVVLPTGFPVFGVIQVDQVKSLDWRARGAEFAFKPPATVLDEVLAKLEPVLFS